MSLDDVYTRTTIARRQLLQGMDHDWKHVDEILGAFWALGDGAAVMIAVNELGREGVIEFSPDWKVRLSAGTRVDS